MVTAGLPRLGAGRRDRARPTAYAPGPGLVNECVLHRPPGRAPGAVRSDAASACQAAIAAWPMLIPPSFGGTAPWTSTSSPASAEAALDDLGEPQVLEHAAGQDDGVDARGDGRGRRPATAAARPMASWNPAASTATATPRSRSSTQPGDERRRIQERHPGPVRDRHRAVVGRCVGAVHAAGQRLELDRRLRLVADRAPPAEQHRDGVEQPAHARGDRREWAGRRGPARRPAGPASMPASTSAAASRPAATAAHTAAIRHGSRMAAHAARHAAPVGGGRRARSRRGRRRGTRRPTACRRGRSPGRRRRAPSTGACGRARPCTRRRGRGGAGRRGSGRSSSRANLVERYSGWRSWATSSGCTP